MCGQLLTCITGGIQGNLERDSGEVDPHLSEKLSHSSSSPSSSSSEDDSSKGTEQRVSSILTNSMGGSWLNNSVHMLCVYPSFVYVSVFTLCTYTSLHFQAGSPSAADVFHDTAGWRHLETYMTLASCIYIWFILFTPLIHTLIHTTVLCNMWWRSVAVNLNLT